MQKTSGVEFLMSRFGLRLLGCWRRYWAVVASFSRAVLVNVGLSIIGCWTVSFNFFMFFASVDDDCSSVASNVDDIA